MFDTCLEYDDHLRANGILPVRSASASGNRLDLYGRTAKPQLRTGPYAETKELLAAFSS